MYVCTENDSTFEIRGNTQQLVEFVMYTDAHIIYYITTRVKNEVS